VEPKPSTSWLGFFTWPRGALGLDASLKVFNHKGHEEEKEEKVRRKKGKGDLIYS